MCGNRIEEKNDLRSFHLGQDILIPYLKIYTLHPCAEINISTVSFKKTHDTAPMTRLLNY